MWNKKSLLAALAAVLVFGGAIGGSVAWLVDQTDPVVNTFTYGDINIKLDEAVVNEDGTKPEDQEGKRTTEGNKYEMVPGRVLFKDPRVTVAADSEDCWLFIKVEEKGGNVTVDGTEYTFDDFLQYKIYDDWKVFDENKGIYYREVVDVPEKTDTAFKVIWEEKVTVKPEVTKDMLIALNEDNMPTLEFTAYAVQKENIANVEDAWKAIEGQIDSPSNP